MANTLVSRFRVENRGHERESYQIQHMSGEGLFGGWVLLQGCTNEHAKLKYVKPFEINAPNHSLLLSIR